MNTVLSLIIMISQNTIRRDNMNYIARYIIDHLFEIDEMNIKTISENCFVSTTSIIKFCQLIGFDTYLEFKRHLYSSLKTRTEQLNTKCSHLNAPDLLNEMQSLCCVRDIQIEELYNNVKKFVSIIDQKRSMNFYGAVFPLALVESFSEDMAVMGIPVHVYQTPFDQIGLEKNTSLNVIVSLTGRFMELNENSFQKLCSFHKEIVIISKKSVNNENVKMQLTLPQTINSDYADIMYLLLLDLIKYEYYQIWIERLNN